MAPKLSILVYRKIIAPANERLPLPNNKCTHNKWVTNKSYTGYALDNTSEHKVHLVSHVMGIHCVFPGTVLEADTSSIGLYNDTLSNDRECLLIPCIIITYESTHNDGKLLTVIKLLSKFFTSKVHFQ